MLQRANKPVLALPTITESVLVIVMLQAVRSQLQGCIPPAGPFCGPSDWSEPMAGSILVPLPEPLALDCFFPKGEHETSIEVQVVSGR